jgi:hypothetical protein
MPIIPLLQTQINDIALAIKERGLEITDFEWQTVDSQNITGVKVPLLIHKPTRYFTLFDFRDPKGQLFSLERCPGRDRLSDSREFESWEAARSFAVNWLDFLKKEIEAPDLWKAISHETSLLTAAADVDSNAPFTAEEQQYIHSQLQGLREYLLTVHRLDPELVGPQIQYLVESAGRMGRKDWTAILVRIIVNVIVSAGLPPETSREILKFAWTLLGNTITSRPPLLP